MTKHDEIANTLTDEILARRFLPGERLPSERDLAVRFEANRGAVREAMKRVAQMGLATIQPGGARVAPLENASLDVIGLMLSRNEEPDLHLVAQILDVMNSLVQVAISHVIAEASNEDINNIRQRLAPLRRGTLSFDEMEVARMEFMRSIMLTSNHLVCQIIARSLFEQLISQVEQLRQRAPAFTDAHRDLLNDLDAALARRDRDAACHALRSLEALNRADMVAPRESAQVVEVSMR